MTGDASSSRWRGFKKHGFKRIYQAIAVMVVMLALLLLPQMVSDTTAITSYIANLAFRNNFHEVVPGRFYRAGEMTHSDLRETIERVGIKTVIDLRLDIDDPVAGQYEKDVVEKEGTAYYHVSLASSTIPKASKLIELLDVFDKSAVPVLVHCSSGTHRTGVASVIWLVENEGWSLDRAQEQLGLKFGFFQIERSIKSFLQGKDTLDDVIQHYGASIATRPESFRQWVKDGMREGAKGEVQTSP